MRPGVQQQMMQRRIGQHHPKVRRAARDVLRNVTRQRVQQYDRRGLRGEQGLLFGGDPAVAARRRKIRHHHREGLLVAMLALAQAGDRIFIRRVAQQLEAADSFERHNPAAAQRRGCARHGARQARSALGARVGLGVEAPIRRGRVFAAACGAHREPAHGGVRPVVGNVQHDAVPRAAQRAVGEGIAKAAVRRIQHLAQAIGTGGEIGEDGGRGRFGIVARLDRKLARTHRLDARCRICQHHRRRRPLALQPLHEACHRSGRAFHFHGQPRVRIAHPSGEPEFARQPVHERPEAHTLNRALQVDAQAFARRGRSHPSSCSSSRSSGSAPRAPASATGESPSPSKLSTGSRHRYA